VIKNILSVVIICLASLSSQAQAPPIVPSQMEFAGIKLKITEGAKREIEETLDLLTRSQLHFQLKVDRSNLYMHFVEKVLKDEGIPDDFKFLAIQEGEFISDAVSTSNAVGFWQFKKATAQELGLRVDNSVDERKHIIASTVGATKYLKRSNFVFDNWVLALQSYLQGLTGTQRSVNEKLYGAKKFEVNKKTHWYVKKFIAHKIAFEGFVGKGIKHPEVNLSDYPVKSKSLKQVSQDLDVDFDELKRFNKWLNQSKIPSEKDYYIIYPVRTGQIIANNSSKKRGAEKPTAEEAIKPQEQSESKKTTSSIKSKIPISRPVSGNVGAYPLITGNFKDEFEPNEIKVNGIRAIRAMQGETINDLARRTNVSVLKIKVYNDLDLKGNLAGGNYYYLKNKKSKGKVHYHVVQPNETLWRISQDYGMKLKKLLSKNRMRKTEELKVGRVLWLRFIRPIKVPIEYSNVIIPASEVIAENRLIKEFDFPQAADEITLSEVPTRRSEIPEEEVFTMKKKPLVASESETIIKHIVEPKESFFGLSEKYDVTIDDILEWNGLNIMDGLKIDQELNLVVAKSQLLPAESLLTSEAIHEVKKGETLWSISKKYGVTIEEILKWNNKSADTLALGERLKILKIK
jgi:peptidoglycan lytic transglycosylase D